MSKLSRETFDELLPGLAALHSETEGDSRVCIALLDGPVDTSHPCFDGADLTLVETLIESCPASGPATQHGTQVASILFGQPGSPLHGIAPRCRGLLLPVFSDLPDGRVRPAPQLDLARAILKAVELGANVINISGGQLVASAEADPYLTNAVRLCAESGVILVAGAGNDGCDCLHVPAALDGALAVGAMDADGQPLEESNWPAAYASRGLLAPGKDIPAANVPDGGVALRTGTSYATAMVSGIAALLLAEQLQRGDSPDSQAVRAAILAGTTPCTPNDDCKRLFRGRLDIPRTRTILLKGGRTMNEQEQITSAAEGPPSGVAAAPELGGVAPGSIAAESAVRDGVSPSSGCGCGGEKKEECTCKDKGEKKSGCGGGGKPTLAYALGRIGYDFGSEARRDSFVQSGLRNPYDPNELLAYLDKNPWAAEDVIFTLQQDSTPIYAVQASGVHGAHTYERLREFLRDAVSGSADTVSIPAYVGGSLPLTSGQTVPVLWPNARGLYSWTRGALLDALIDPKAPDKEQRAGAIGSFLDRVSYELRNLGIDPRERALNYAATNAFQVGRVYESAIRDSLSLDTISVERSPICRPHSDCWDVKLTFFDPNQRLTRSRRVYRFTVDVSEVIPVTVGAVRQWDVF